MLSPKELEKLSGLVIDLGKILFGAAVIGFFIPGFSGAVTPVTFITGTLLSSALFAVGVKLIK